MVWSYDGTLAAPKDRIRALIQDIDETEKLIDDELILLYVPGGTYGQESELLAAAACAQAIGAKLARRPTSLTAGGTTVNWGKIAQNYYDLAEQLRAADEASNATGLFDWAEMVPDAFSARERLRDQVLRGVG